MNCELCVEAAAIDLGSKGRAGGSRYRGPIPIIADFSPFVNGNFRVCARFGALFGTVWTCRTERAVCKPLSIKIFPKNEKKFHSGRESAENRLKFFGICGIILR